MGLEIRLLGGFRVVLDGAEVRLPTRKAAALLAVLASEPGKGYSRDNLAAMLWPGSGETQGKASLRQTLAQIRKHIPGVGSHGSTLVLSPDNLTVDTVSGPYGGPFLEGEAPLEEGFDAWTRDRRRFFEQDAIGRIDAALVSDSGTLEQRLAVAEQGLRIDPTHEPFHRAVIRLHLAGGDRARAVKAYEHCRAILKEQLGVTPSDATSALMQEVAAKTDPLPIRPRERTRTIAVLPFDNLSEDPEQGYFADGLAEDILTELSRFRALAVTARNSSFAYRGHGRPVTEIAAELGVSYLLEGSVRKAGDRLRLSAQLVDGGDGTQMWGERFDVAIDAMFDVQDEITQAVTGALALNIQDVHTAHARRRHPDDLEAYDLYLRGLACIRLGSTDSDEEARNCFQRSVEIDPQFARGYMGLSLSHFNEWSCQVWDRWEEKSRLAFENANKALELDDGDHLTHCILGRVYVYRRDYALAERHLNRSLALNPNDADSLMHICFGKLLLGDHEQALDLARTAMRLNPGHPSWYEGLTGYPLLMLRRYEEAVEFTERAADVFVDGRAILAAAYGKLGNTEAAARNLERFLITFRTKITHGRDPEPGEPLRWILHINPFRREEDETFLKGAMIEAGI